MAGGILRELLIRLGVDGDTKGLEAFDKKVEGVFAKIKAGAAVVTEALGLKEIGEFFNSQIEGAAHVQDLSDKLDVSATTLKQWGFAAQQSGVDFEESAAAIGHFNQHVGEAVVKGGEVAQAFAQLHVQLKQVGQTRPIVDLLLDTADSMKKLPDQAHRAAYAQQLFGRSGRQLLPVLAQGKEKIQELMAEADKLGSGLGDQFYADAKKTRAEMEKFNFALGSIKARITAVVLPVVTQLAKQAQGLALRFINLTKTTHVATTLIEFLAALIGVRLVASVRKLAFALKLLKPSIWETVLSLLRFALPLAILGLLYLAFDDLYTLMQGGQSVIGDTIDKMFGVGAAKQFVEQLKDAWKDLSASLEGLKPSLQGIIDAFKQGLPGAIVFTIDTFVRLVGLIDSAVTGARELVLLIEHIFAGKNGSSILDQLDAMDKAFQARRAGRQGIVDVLEGTAAPPGRQALSAAAPPDY